MTPYLRSQLKVRQKCGGSGVEAIEIKKVEGKGGVRRQFIDMNL